MREFVVLSNILPKTVGAIRVGKLLYKPALATNSTKKGRTAEVKHDGLEDNDDGLFLVLLLLLPSVTPLGLGVRDSIPLSLYSSYGNAQRMGGDESRRMRGLDDDNNTDDVLDGWEGGGSRGKSLLILNSSQQILMMI